MRRSRKLLSVRPCGPTIPLLPLRILCQSAHPLIGKACKLQVLEVYLTGLFLIVAFSIGLAAVLIGVGLLMVYARRFMSGLRTEGLLFPRWLPLTSAAVITLLGLAIAVRSLITGGILQIRA